MAKKPRRVSGRRSKKAGLPPGTLVYVGDKTTETVRIVCIDYNSEHYEEREAVSTEDCYPYKESLTTTWINVDGLHEVEIVEELGKEFGVHPLALEDSRRAGSLLQKEEMVLNLLAN